MNGELLDIHETPVTEMLAELKWLTGYWLPKNPTDSVAAKTVRDIELELASRGVKY